MADIAGETVRQMASAFGCRLGDIRAAIGPGIGPCCFETGAEVPEAVMEVLGDIGDAALDCLYLQRKMANSWWI